MLRSLEIQNFKGIKQGKLEDLAQVNVLVGRNNSGKSTILDALIMLRSALAGLDYLDREGFDQITKRRVDRGQFNGAELWFMMNTEVPILFTAEVAGGTNLTESWTPTLDCTIKWDSYEGHTSRNYNSFRKSANQLREDLKQSVGEAQVLYLAQIHLLDATSVHSPLAEHLWPELVRSRRDNKVRQLLEAIYKLEIDYLTSMPFPQQQRLVAALPHAGVAVDWLGDGMRYAVNILALGVLLQGTALLVEELETHQHPESLRMLIQTLFELAKQRDLQLFLTTHSMELISYTLDAAQEKDVSLKLHHLSLDREGTLTSISFSQPNAQLMLDIGHDPRLHYKHIKAEQQ